MTSAHPRPRIVEVAFWTWVAASILVVFFGILIATSNAPALYRGAGVVFSVAGLTLAYLAYSARNGRSRFRWAAVALALTLILLVILFEIVWQLGPGWLLIVILLLTGSFAATRDTASAWFNAPNSGSDGG
jgi:hypothetical protein